MQIPPMMTAKATLPGDRRRKHPVRHGKPGRPSLTGDGASPSIAFRVPAALRERAEEIATLEHKTVSEVAREALEAHLAAS